jgi:hypothetical protein
MKVEFICSACLQPASRQHTRGHPGQRLMTVSSRAATGSIANKGASRKHSMWLHACALSEKLKKKSQPEKLLAPPQKNKTGLGISAPRFLFRLPKIIKPEKNDLKV